VLAVDAGAAAAGDDDDYEWTHIINLDAVK
jgi:hypothetical protein